MTTEDSDDGDKIGYKRPPRHGRFRAGQSGNPRGRIAVGVPGQKFQLQPHNGRLPLPGEVSDFAQIGQSEIEHE